MKNYAISLLLFIGVSCASLFAMKFILWTMFNWGGLGAIILALIFISIYIGGFILTTRVWENYDQHVSHAGMKCIWILGFVQLAVLGILYHLLPQFFPAFIAEFFFS